MQSAFFAMLTRMKYIPRWTLMHNVRTENLCEHTAEVAFLAHALATIENERCGGQVDAGKCALLALYHDVPEILTGDLPTPVKYRNDDIRNAYKQVEAEAAEQIVGRLPADLQAEYRPLLLPEASAEARLVKAADKLSALIKCTQELQMGNREFAQAYDSTKAALDGMELPAVRIFLQEFMPAYELSLDEQQTLD